MNIKIISALTKRKWGNNMFCNGICLLKCRGVLKTSICAFAKLFIMVTW